jgi:hypothetical protein
MVPSLLPKRKARAILKLCRGAREIMSSITVKGHVVICGWNERGYSIIQQLHQDVIKDKKPILIVSEKTSDIVFTDDDIYNNVES